MKPDYGNMESTAGVLGRSCMLDLTPSPSRVVAAFLTDHDVDDGSQVGSLLSMSCLTSLSDSDTLKARAIA
jgi:hypothetical protein